VARILVVVEGQTEEAFINNVLAPEFWPKNIYMTPILIGRPGHKGGRVNYDRLSRDVLTLLKQQHDAYCTTMVDLYGLGAGFPGTPPPPHFSSIEKVRHVEHALKEDICGRIPEFRPGLRFVPYIQLHEYEGLLFSDPDAFASGIGQYGLSMRFRRIRDEFDTPEDINDSPETAPSKRVIAAYPRYRKVIEGTQAAGAVGINAMRSECLHFREWLEMLESIQ
jgi:hypothetical protein